MCYQNADVDECDQQLAPCNQVCNNTDGSFICSCNDGYYLGDDMLTCYGESPHCKLAASLVLLLYGHMIISDIRYK